MANPGLLIRRTMRSFSLCAAAAALASCALGPIWAMRIAGRVTDADTGEPIEGALVVSYYVCQGFLSPGSDTVDHQAVKTDPDGRFSIPAHFSMPLGEIAAFKKPAPVVQIITRDHGLFGFDYNPGAFQTAPPRDYGNIEYRLKRDPNAEWRMKEVPAQRPCAHRSSRACG